MVQSAKNGSGSDNVVIRQTVAVGGRGIVKLTGSRGTKPAYRVFRFTGPCAVDWLPLLGRPWQYPPDRLFPLGVNSINDGTLEHVSTLPIVRWTAVAGDRSP